MSDVRAGQIWADNDPRVEGRTLRVEFVGAYTVSCRILTNSHDVQASIDRGGTDFADRRGKITRIRMDRFKPTSTGYRLLDDPGDLS